MRYGSLLLFIYTSLIPLVLGESECHAIKDVDCPDHPAMLELGLCVNMSKPNIYIFLLVVVLIIVLIEKAVHTLDHYVAKKHISYQAVLHHIYRELMLLGIVSFILYLLQTSRSCEIQKRLDVQAFEFAHFLVFFASIFYVALVLLLLVFVRGAFRTWYRIQNISVEELRRNYFEKKSQWELSKWWQKIFSLRLYIRYKIARQNYFFLLLRSSFLFRFQDVIYRFAVQAYEKVDLEPPPKDVIISSFDFVRYLRKCCREVLLNLLNIPLIIIVVVVILLLIQFIRLFFDGGVKIGIFYYILFFGYVILIPCFSFLHFALNFVQKKYRKAVVQSSLRMIPYKPSPLVPVLHKAPISSKLPLFAKTSSITPTSSTLGDLLAVSSSSPNPNENFTSLKETLLVHNDSLNAIQIWNVIPPGLYMLILQILTFWVCIYFSVAILYIDVHIDYEGRDRGFFYILTWFPIIFSCAIILPRALPTYAALVATEGNTKNIRNCFRGKFIQKLKALKHSRKQSMKHSIKQDEGKEEGYVQILKSETRTENDGLYFDDEGEEQEEDYDENGSNEDDYDQEEDAL